jgi:hypothetical protein
MTDFADTSSENVFHRCNSSNTLRTIMGAVLNRILVDSIHIESLLRSIYVENRNVMNIRANYDFAVSYGQTFDNNRTTK